MISPSGSVRMRERNGTHAETRTIYFSRHLISCTRYQHKGLCHTHSRHSITVHNHPAFLELYWKQDEQRELLEVLDRTASLIDGFQSPMGMELLATVDWLIERDRCKPTLTGKRRGHPLRAMRPTRSPSFISGAGDHQLKTPTPFAACAPASGVTLTASNRRSIHNAPGWRISRWFQHGGYLSVEEDSAHRRTRRADGRDGQHCTPSNYPGRILAVLES